MRTNGANTVSTFFHDQRCCLRQGTSCVTDIIDQHDVLSGYITNNRHRFDLISAFSLFITDNHLCVEVLRKSTSPVRTTHIWRRNCQIDRKSVQEGKYEQ